MRDIQIEPFLKPQKRQNYHLIFEEKIKEGIHYFHCRDFLLFHDSAKLYSPGIRTDCCKKKIVFVFKLFYMNLFLFYGKRFFFYCRNLACHVSTYIFHHGHSGYIGRYFRQETNRLSAIGRCFDRKKYLSVILLQQLYRYKILFENENKPLYAYKTLFGNKNKPLYAYKTLFENENKPLYAYKTLFWNRNRTLYGYKALFENQNRNLYNVESRYGKIFLFFSSFVLFF